MQPQLSIGADRFAAVDLNLHERAQTLRRASAGPSVAYVATATPPGRTRSSALSRTAMPPPPTKSRSGSGRSRNAPGAASLTTTAAVPIAFASICAAASGRVDREHPQTGNESGRFDPDIASSLSAAATFHCP